MIPARKYTPETPPTARDVSTALGVLNYVANARVAAEAPAGYGSPPMNHELRQAQQTIQALAPYLLPAHTSPQRRPKKGQHR